MNVEFVITASIDSNLFPFTYSWHFVAERLLEMLVFGTFGMIRCQGNTVDHIIIFFANHRS